jgi:UTP--glucose-1-phosphate uridylyltransferase
LLIANLDNIGASIDPVLFGWHLEHGNPVSVEVVDKVGSDRGGIPVRHQGRPVILEEPRLPIGFDAAGVRVFNTNTLWLDARAIETLDMPWTFIQVGKKVGPRTAVQFERLIGELPYHLATSFVRVPREGLASRFLPVKDNDELAMRRSEIEAIAHARGMLDASQP